ncbi:thrombomodulin-like [Entelurus aequoreus]|uniref:thrombomodulin-like n=1 Tax=Entelurus aequoreus TaxID=161455 RepID=UPI002B1DB264|nr:thrombomodulin-like [Entelurus aequoreus]
MIAFLTCALFICGLQKSAHCQRGLCSGSRCFALFRDTADFRVAQESCRNVSGTLLPPTSVDEDVRSVLKRAAGGPFWLGGQKAPHCSSVSVTLGGGKLVFQSLPCETKLSGFVCTYAVEEPCNDVTTAAGAAATYTAPMDIALNHTFPQGTIAVAGKSGARHPDSKHLCFGRTWLRAPWNCEVLRGGCEHGCNVTSGSCVCPPGQHLHANLITCVTSRQNGSCPAGYEPAREGGCVRVDACALHEPCTGEGEECVSTRDGFECTCTDGWVEEDGVCVDMRVCEKCEHMMCVKLEGVYACACREGYRLSASDPARCDLHCEQQDCSAECVHEHECFCPEGYIQDVRRNNTPYCTDINECEIQLQCEHTCTNNFGSFLCSCNEGYTLYDGYMCVHDYDLPVTHQSPTPAGARPAALPPYVKTGSVLGIGVFVLLALGSVYFLVKHLNKRCGSLQVSSIKRPRVDIFYLQQVSTETYKKLSWDKSELQRL